MEKGLFVNISSYESRYPWLDLTRFIAALMVVCSHARGALFVEYGLLPEEQQNNPIIFGFYFISRLGHEAVLAFFVLSGFLVGGKVIQRLEKGTFDIKSYTIDRVARIMLPLIGTLLLIAVINFIVGESNNAITLLGNLFSLQGIFVNSATAPLWSLAYEVWFYVLMGAIAFLILQKSHPSYNIISCLIIICVFMIFTKLKAIYLFVWILGSFSVLFTLRKKIYYLIFSILLMVLSIILLQMTSESRSVGLPLLNYLPSRDVIYLLFTLFMSIMIKQLIMFQPQRKFAIKIDKIGTYLAKFSYTLYLTHVPVLHLLSGLFKFSKSKSVNIISLAYFLLAIFICLSVSYIMYLLFEKHTFVVKRYLKRVLQ